MNGSIATRAGAIPEEEVAATRADQIDLMVDRGLQAVIGDIAVGNRADRHAIVGESARIVKNPIDTGTDHTALFDIECAIERQITMHIKQRLGRRRAIQRHICLAARRQGQAIVKSDLLVRLPKKRRARRKACRTTDRTVTTEIGLITDRQAAAQDCAIQSQIAGPHIHCAAIAGAVGTQNKRAGTGLGESACAGQR